MLKLSFFKQRLLQTGGYLVKMVSLMKDSAVIRRSAVASCLTHAAYGRMGSGQRTTKGWHTAGDKVITSIGWGTTFRELMRWWR
jgi:hypothetical protein